MYVWLFLSYEISDFALSRNRLLLCAFTFYLNRHLVITSCLLFLNDFLIASRGRRYHSKLSWFTFKSFLPIDFFLILLKLCVFLSTHIVNSFVGVLSHLLQKLAHIHILLVRRLFKLCLNWFLPKLLHWNARTWLSAFRLSYFRELILSSRHIKRLILVGFNFADLCAFDDKWCQQSSVELWGYFFSNTSKYQTGPIQMCNVSERETYRLLSRRFVLVSESVVFGANEHDRHEHSLDFGSVFMLAPFITHSLLK